MTSPTEMFPISQDPQTQNQVASILFIRELSRIANGEPTELERRTAKATPTRSAKTTQIGLVRRMVARCRKAFAHTLPPYPSTD